MLLGQSAITKLGKIQIDFNANTLTILDSKEYSEIRDNFEYFQRGKDRFKLKDYQGAIEAYTKAIEIDPRFYEAWYNRGISKGELLDYKSAISDFTTAIEINPSFYLAYFNRG